MRCFVYENLRVTMNFAIKNFGVSMIFCSKNLRDTKIFSNFAPDFNKKVYGTSF